jgi:hypothetical protein
MMAKDVIGFMVMEEMQEKVKTLKGESAKWPPR